MEWAIASTLRMPSNPNQHETLAALLHDLAGSLTVLSLSLPQLSVVTKGSSAHEEVLDDCLTAATEANKTLKSAWLEIAKSSHDDLSD